MSKKPRKQIAVRSIGKPDFELAAELLVPLFLKIHKRNQEQRLSQPQGCESDGLIRSSAQ